MNCKVANEIPLTDVVNILCDLPPGKVNGRSIWYLSPFRQEKTPSFRIDTVSNKWFDFGKSGKNEGTVVDFVMEYNNCSVSEALEFISRYVTGTRSNIHNSFFSFHEQNVSPPPSNATTETTNISLISKEVLSNYVLINYLKSRSINLTYAKKFLFEIYFQNKKLSKKYFALGFNNDSNGIEYRNKYIHGVIGNKDCSSINININSGEVFVFEGVLDYLSFLTHKGDDYLDRPAIILNSVSISQKVIDMLNKGNVQTVNLYLDNDIAGDKSTSLFLSQIKVPVIDNRFEYKEYKDYNDFLISLTIQN